jgi:hypothetical protein
VKPSERIRQIASAAPLPGMGELAILVYLDEQAELEQRRVHVRNALSMVGLGCSLTRLREQLDKAGLQVFVDVGDTWHEAHARIVDEAKREGLF